MREGINRFLFNSLLLQLFLILQVLFYAIVVLQLVIGIINLWIDLILLSDAQDIFVIAISLQQLKLFF